MATGGRTRVYIDATADQLEREIRRAEMALERLGREGLENGRQASQGMGQATLATRAYARTAAGAAAVTSRVTSAARTAAPYVGTGLALALGKSVIEAREAEKAMSQTRAVIASTGGVANVSAKELATLSEALSEKVGIDDEAIQSGGNLLLTFRNIRNEAGEGNKIFDRTLPLLTDMSVALGTDMKSSALQLGKALNDPASGLTALRRSGVAFDEQQQEQIKTLFASGQQLKAQKMILAEVSKEFEGSAAAQADSLDKLKVSAENMAESLGTKMMPTLNEMADELSGIMSDESLTAAEKTDALADFFEEWAKKGIDAAEDAAPTIARVGGKIALRAIDGFIDAWWESDLLGKMFLGAGALRFFGGPGVFGKLGGRIATTIGGGVGGGMGPAGTRGGRVFATAFGAAVTVWALANRKELIDQLVPEGAINDALHDAFDVLPPVEAVEEFKRSLEEGIGDDDTGDSFWGDFWDGFTTGADAADDALKSWVNYASVGLIDFRDEAEATEEDLGHLAEGVLGLAAASGQMGHGLRITQNRLRGAAQATRFFSGELLNGVDSVKKWERAVRRSADDVGDALEDTGDIARGVTRGVGRDLGDSSRDHDRWSKDARRDLDRVGDEFKRTGDIVDNFATSGGRDLDRFNAKSRQMAKGVGRNIIGVAGVITEGLGIIGDNTNEALEAFGVKKIALSLKKVGSAAKGFQGGGSVFAVPGTGTGDSFPMMVPPDSFVLNREAAAAFFPRQLGGAVPIVTEPGELVFGPEAVAQMGGFLGWANDTVRRFAGGGMVDPAGPGIGVVNRAIADVVGAWSQRYDAAINYGYDPGGGHVSPGHNVTGTATDTGPAAGWGDGPTQLFETGLRQLVNSGLTVLYGSHGVGTPYPNHGYGNHAHIEWGMHPEINGLAAAAGATIARLLVKGPDGPMKEMSQSALDKARKAAIAYIAEHSGGAMGGDIGAPIRSLPEALQKYNRTYAEHNSAEGDWGGYRMPFNAVAALAEWAGAPGVSMARTAIGESNLRPGATGEDEGGTKGYGVWMITTSFNDDLVKPYGGYGQMLNPVLNAKVMDQILDRQGYGAWYSDTLDTSGTHYSGPLLRQKGGPARGLAAGGFAGGPFRRLAGGGKGDGGSGDGGKNGDDKKGGWDEGKGAVIFPVPGPGPLSYAEKLTKIEILLAEAEQTDDISDDLKLLGRRLRLITEQRDRVAEQLEDLHLTRAERQRADREADAKVDQLRERLKKGGLTKAEERRLAREDYKLTREAERDALREKRSGLLDKLSGLTSEVSSTREQMESLREESLADLVESVKSLKESIDEQTTLISRESTVQRSELVRAIADLLSGEIGGRTSMAGMNAGYGSVIAA